MIVHYSIKDRRLAWFTAFSLKDNEISYIIGLMENMTTIAQTLGIKEEQVNQVLTLAGEGNTIPFIARYRKEVTGNLDEVAIKSILDLDKSLTNLAERKASVLAKIEEQGKLTPDLEAAIKGADKLADVEELYLPYKEKRRTKATIAREQGLADLTRLILLNDPQLLSKAQDFISDQVPTAEEALAGAVHILIEALAEDSRLRSWTYNEIWSYSQIKTSLKDDSLDDKQVFHIYYDFSEKLADLKGYRVLAINRGEKLGVLTVKFDHHLDKIIRFYQARFKTLNIYIEEAVVKAAKSKIIPAMERRIWTELTELAEEGAISLFSTNLRQLLLVSPLKGKVVLGFDPAFRTGAKLAIVDQTGKLLTTEVIYPVPPASASKIEQAKERLSQLIETYGVEIIAIGNGTASRESEAFVAQVLQKHPATAYVIVNESGASVYSASELARTEFPDLTVEKRSAISIARRLQDPLAELVKIDPKSIGVGQYQHDVSQKKLSDQLGFVVETVVNQVGVNVNTASSALLSHVAGLNKSISDNIIKYREEKGPLTNRQDLKKVPRLGAKAFEQAAGFLRIPDGDNILDNTGVHPESYGLVSKLFADLAISQIDDEAKAKLCQLDVAKTAQNLGIGSLTLTDIIADLLKPGRDLRDEFATPVLRQDILELKDLQLGQVLEGTVRNIVDFGAFVDIGLHDDGLIHISDMSTSFVKHPSQVLSVGEIVTVWIKTIDYQREKLNLSLVPLDGSD